MGNCLTSQIKVVKIMTTDDQIFVYRACIKAEEILSEFGGHALSDMLPVRHYLKPNTELVAGRLYYLLPAPPTRSPKVGRKVTFSEPESTQVGEKEIKKASLRVKLVISRQELKEMLGDGIVSMKDVVTQLQTNGTETGKQNEKYYDNETWMPSLKCIPEVDL